MSTTSTTEPSKANGSEPESRSVNASALGQFYAQECAQKKKENSLLVL